MLSRPLYSSRQRRSWLTATFFATVVVFLIMFNSLDHSGFTEQHALPFGLKNVINGQNGMRGSKSCSEDLDYLRRTKYKLTRNIVFQKQCFQGFRNESVDRSEVESLDKSLLAKGQVLDVGRGCKTQKEEIQEISCEPISIDVPAPFPGVDFSDVIFGVATSHQRLGESIEQFSHWLSYTGGKLLAVVTDGKISEKKLKSIAARYQERGIDMLPIQPWSRAYDVKEQHFTIIRDLLSHATEDTKWVVVIDDDTFFPSPYSIAELLDEHDSSDPVYMGGLSEDPVAVDFHGYMAFGGAGVFMSMPLIKELDPNLDVCLKESYIREGDGLLSGCIKNRTETKLTVVPELHQFDINGDLSGFYESGRFPLSLHHWKSWHQAPVDKMAKVTGFCGECFLQRWLFGGNTQFTNGYSIAVFEDGIKASDLERTEGTWDRADAYADMLGPLRPKTETERKKSYHLIDAERIGDGLRQLYVHRASKGADDHKHTELMDEVVEIWWDFPV